MPKDSEPVCPKCGGSGYAIVVAASGESAADPCECLAQAIQTGRERQSNIPARFAGATFSSWRTESANPPVSRLRGNVYSAVYRFAKDYRPLTLDRRGLLLIGPPGTGKTHLAVAALRTIIANGCDGVYYDYQSLLGMIQRGWNREAGIDEKQAWNRAIETEMLLLDDLGAKRSLEWVEDVITEIITVRYNENRPIIATTNLPDPALFKDGLPPAVKTLSEVIGERSRSRLFEMCHVIYTGGMDDYRLRSVMVNL